MDAADTRPETRPTHAERAHQILGIVAGIAGVAYMWWVIGGVILLQYDRILDPPIEWLRDRALWAVPVIILALAARRMRWPTVAIGALVGLWLGAGAISSWRLTGDLDGRSLMLGLVCAGLFFGVAASRPLWTGWSIFLLGAGWVFLTVYVYYRSYYSLGQAFPGTTWWWSTVQSKADSMTSIKEWRGGYYFAPLPYPDGRLERIRALIFDVPRFESIYEGLRPFQFRGLTGNGNMTGNFLAPFLVFVAPFIAHRLRGRRTWHWSLIIPARIGLTAAVLVPGLFILYVMDARAALGGVLASLLVLAIPLAWARNAAAATLAAILIPAGFLVPFLLTRLQGLSWNGRDCIWNDLWIPTIRDSLLWGIGPPGRLSDTCTPGSTTWYHAHNEFFQAWSIGGILGVTAAVAAVAALAWFAVRFSDRDDRALLALLVCCMVLMGFEVLSSFRANYLHLGIAWFVVITARSMGMLLRARSSPDQRESQLSRM